MSRMQDHHEKLTNGKGKCSVPMWNSGCPSGFCDADAFGSRPPAKEYMGPAGYLYRMDGKYAGYIPGLACPAHGGPKCPGIEIEPGVFSGCDASAGDCQTCGK